MEVTEAGLTLDIDEVLAKTDATIFVSNCYNPTAEGPQTNERGTAELANSLANAVR